MVCHTYGVADDDDPTEITLQPEYAGLLVRVDIEEHLARILAGCDVRHDREVPVLKGVVALFDPLRAEAHRRDDDPRLFQDVAVLFGDRARPFPARAFLVRARHAAVVSLDAARSRVAGAVGVRRLVVIVLCASQRTRQWVRGTH